MDINKRYLNLHIHKRYRPYVMKTIKYILISLAIIFGIVLLIGFFLILAKTFRMEFDFTSTGFSRFILEFNSLRKLFTVTIALLSMYFILFQIENITKSNKRTEEILENDIKSKTLEQSFFFYTRQQLLIREIYLLISKESDYLLSQSWVLTEFTDHSVNEQNPKWEKKYERLVQPIKDKIINILNQFESLSATILNGNIDKDLAFNLFGRPFNRQIETLYPFISGYRSREKPDNEDNYNSIVKLYNEWKLLINK